MSKFINEILKEITKDDLFFQPKDIEKRDEEEKRKREELVLKIKLGLQNIRKDYGNKNWESKEEKLFLKIFSKFYLSEKYDKYWDGYFLKDRNDKKGCFFDLKYDRFWVSYEDIWKIFEGRFHWNHNKIQSFMKNMLQKHFKLYEFTCGCL